MLQTQERREIVATLCHKLDATLKKLFVSTKDDFHSLKCELSFLLHPQILNAKGTSQIKKSKIKHATASAGDQKDN